MPVAAIDFPAIDPVAVRIGPLSIHWYGLAYLAGFAAAALVLRWLARRWDLGLSDDDVLTVVLASVIGVIVGARLGYVLVYGEGYYLRNPAEILAIWDGGMSFHGGLFGILIGGAIAARLVGVSWLRLCDMGAVGAPVGIALGRLANFINGELWGRPTDVAWAVVFPAAGPMGRHPSQLYEAALEGVALFVVMLILARKRPPRPAGELLGWMVSLYGTFRTFAEFFREPDAQLGFIAGGATMGQLLSVPMVVVGAALVVWSRRRRAVAD